MYEKGRSFLMAAGLIKAYAGHRFVYLHLLCQGLENVGKAILIRLDEPRYGPALKDRFGHDLEILVGELKTHGQAGFLSEQAESELIRINNFYKRHRLRYGDKIDTLPNALEIQADALHRDLVRVLARLNEDFGERGSMQYE